MQAAAGTRAHIVHAADELFYRHGYEHTSFADIAEMVQISRGNFYYHFKTKDEILQAVIALRRERTQGMLDGWEAAGDTPMARVRSFIEILLVNQAKIMRYGCPVGTLCAELAKLNHDALGNASGVFTLFRNWLRRQFAAMGRGRDADKLAMHVLARSQGVAALATAFRDGAFVRREVGEMITWLEAQADGGGSGPKTS